MTDETEKTVQKETVLEKYERLKKIQRTHEIQTHSVVRARLIIEQNNKCFYCGNEFTEEWPAEVEHVTPKVYLSKDIAAKLSEPWNLVAACHICNNVKWKSVFGNKIEAKLYIERTIQKRFAHLLSPQVVETKVELKEPETKRQGDDYNIGMLKLLDK